jgi:hypothetical protein
MEDVCTCNEEHEEHTCPFAEEIHGSDALCTCCPECEDQCAMDI